MRKTILILLLIILGLGFYLQWKMAPIYKKMSTYSVTTEEPEVVAEKREYFPVTVKELAAGKNFHTHIEVTGRVVMVRREGDGDLHIKLLGNGAFIVAECVPELPCNRPKVGQMVTVRGISRFDGEHKWYECHPVESLEVK